MENNNNNFFTYGLTPEENTCYFTRRLRSDKEQFVPSGDEEYIPTIFNKFRI